MAMELFPRQDEKTNADAEFSSSFKKFTQAVQTVCISSFRLFGLLISIIYGGLFKDRGKKKENMSDLEKKIASEEFRKFGDELSRIPEKSMSESEIINKARRRYE